MKQKKAGRPVDAGAKPKFCSRKATFPRGGLGEGEDERSVSGHIDLMRREVRKAGGGDAEKVAQSMEMTFFARRKLIEGEKPSLEELFHVYPALRGEREVYREFHRLTGVNVEVDLPAVVEKYGSRVLSLAFDSRKKAKMPDAADSYGFSVAVLSSLPLLVKEKPEALLSKLEPGETSPYPTIVFSGHTAEESGAVTVNFEELQLTAIDIILPLTVSNAVPSTAAVDVT
ncbi:uncharacterized protein LOC144166040 [Haemaphysalis longicornis]